MNLGIFLAFKESMTALEKTGQTERFIDYYLKPYSQAFENIYIYSWENESFDFPFSNVHLIPNRKNLNQYLYNFLLPIIEKETLKKCPVLRLTQFTPILPAAIAKIFFGSKIYCTYGYIYHRILKIGNKWAKIFLWKIIELLALKFADIISTTQEGIRDYLLEKGVPTKKIRIIRNGVDINTFYPPENRRFSTPSEDDYLTQLLFVGRHEKEKNLINLAHALAISRFKNEFHLKLVGKTGTLTEIVKNILDKERISYEIIPSVPHNQLPSFYRQADIFLLPSLTEGYSKVLIEAMACGLPSIVARYKDHQYVAKNNENCLTCNFDAKSIRDTLDKLLSDTILRKKISDNSRRFAKENNDIRKLVDQEIQNILSLAGS